MPASVELNLILFCRRGERRRDERRGGTGEWKPRPSWYNAITEYLKKRLAEFLQPNKSVSTNILKYFKCISWCSFAVILKHRICGILKPFSCQNQKTPEICSKVYVQRKSDPSLMS